ncbi:BgTH12-02737 [Blumeria graminis f. sp. triticale]|uniref:Large ribosomal subunit protein mL49 n=3 Tax=Blumeria graminis TaxID=34373 RepID=A0A061HQ49_BLUGR|nr:hypothetical protein BGT96224_1855 [Blumeria graminis f. sp. tritici 96224]CAD6503067.1 BgTH12-02737 [Blumeria graminis f. sp. triticale]VDB89005.1 Bgt-1855 [Blumeria graminis f. sp. tritici]
MASSILHNSSLAPSSANTFHIVRRFVTAVSTYSHAETTPSLRPYLVRRTPSKQLPIYHVTKNGGNKKLTKIGKVEGDTAALTTELRTVLALDEKECRINPLTGHVLVKGHRKSEIIKFLEERRF